VSEKIHQSRAETEQRTYERVRKDGVPQEAARQIAREASETTHRKIDADPRRR